MATILPPYFPGNVDETFWTGPTPGDATGESIDPPGIPHDYTNGAEGQFVSGQYSSNSQYAPTISYKQVLTTLAGRRYTLECVVVKLTAGLDPIDGTAPYVKPGFVDLDANANVNMTGAQDSNGFSSSSAGGAYNTAAWPLGTPITIRPYWVANVSHNVRVRCRFNRGLTNSTAVGNGYSTSTFQLLSFKFFSEIHAADLQTQFSGPSPFSMSDYYRGGSYVSGTNTRVPTSGTIRFSDFFGAE